MKSNHYQELQTPCFIFDEQEFERGVCGFKEALRSFFDRVEIGYSVKTNSLPYALQQAEKHGCKAEVVSHDEYQLARMCGYEPSEIIYNGPMKSHDTFVEAVTGGAVVNIETKRELDWLKDLPSDGYFSVGIRLNINISSVSPEDADGDNDNSRFGYSDETDEFVNAINFIKSLPNVRLCGLHIHRTSHSRSPRFYKGSIRYACEVINKYGLNLDYIDVGGGYFGIFPNKPTFQDYAATFYEVLKEYDLEKLCVIIEPGNALTASSFSFLSEVIDVKHVERDLWFITTDGSRNDIDPFFKKTSYLDEELYQAQTDAVPEQIVSGCTCLEYDRFFTLCNKPLLAVGDRILYHNVGAYTMCLTPLFIRYIPNIYLKQSNHYSLIREKWTATEYIQKSKIK